MTAAKQLQMDEHIPAHVDEYVRRELRDYPVHKETVEAYEQERKEIMNRNRQWPPPEGGRAEGTVSDPTHDTMLRLEALDMRTYKARRNVRIMESVMRVSSEEQQRLVRMRYWDPKPMTDWEVADAMNMGRDRYYAVRREIVRKIALRMGLI